MWKRLTITLLVAVAVIGATLVFVSRVRMAETHATYRIEHQPPPGWLAAKRQPSTLFHYMLPGNEVAISGFASHIRIKNDDIKLNTADDLAEMMIRSAPKTKPTFVVQRLTALNVGSSAYEVVRRDRPERSIVSAIRVVDGTTLMVSLVGRPKNVDAQLPVLRELIERITWIVDKTP